MSKELTVEQKAARYDALMNCDRIRILGYARGGPEGKDGHIQHLGMELWAKHSGHIEGVSRTILEDFLEGLVSDSSNP